VFIGVVDWLEWGRPFGSFYEYIRVNVGEKYAQRHGVEPWTFYLLQLKQIFGASSLVIAAGVLISVVTRPRLTLALLVPLVGYSAFAHKELRFMVPLVPLLLAAATAGLDDAARWLGRRLSTERGRRLLPAAAGALLLWVLGSAFWAVQRWPIGNERGYFVAQDHVGEQADASGLLVGTTRFYTGGYTLIHRNIPFEFFSVTLLDHALFNYVAVSGQHEVNIMGQRRDYRLVDRSEGVSLFKRRP
jgi:hypothetical protein